MAIARRCCIGINFANWRIVAFACYDEPISDL